MSRVAEPVHVHVLERKVWVLTQVGLASNFWFSSCVILDRPLMVSSSVKWGTGLLCCQDWLPDLESENLSSHLQSVTYLLRDLGQVTSAL